MRFLVRVKQASLLVGLFCCLFMVQSSTSRADDTTRKPMLAFFVDENGYEFGGVIARTLADEQVVWLGTAFARQGVDMRLYRMTEEQFLDALSYEKNQERDYETVRPFKVKTSKLDEISHFSRAGEDGKVRTRVSLPISEPGIYYLQGQSGSDASEAILVVSNIVAQAKEEDRNLTIWTADSRNGKHVNGGEVVSYNLSGKRDRLSQSGIDGDGIGRIAEEEKGDLVVVHALGETAFIPLNYGSHAPQPVSYGWWGGNFAPRQNTVMSYAYTDRSLYQPGDTVYFKSFAREDDDARYSPAKGVAKVKVWTGYGEDETVVLERSYPLSGNGTFDGNLVLPKDVKTGDYYLSISYPEYGQGESGGGYYYFSGQTIYFTVDNYRKPDFGLDVVVDHDRFIVGDTFRAKVSGSLFSGEPLSGEEIQYTVTAGTYYDYEYYSPDRKADGYRYGYGYGPTIQSGTVTLDADGQAELEVLTKSHEKFLPQIYRIEVTGNDSAENPVFESQNVLVMPADFSIYRTDYSYSAKISEEASIPLILVSNRDGVNLSGRKLEASGKLTRWIREDRPNEKYPYYREENRVVPSISFETDGDGKTTLKFTPEETGSYEFTVRGTDDRGNVTSRSVWLWVPDRDGTYYQGDQNGRGSSISIKADKEQYRPNESVQLTLSSTLPDRDVWVTFERDGVHRSRTVELHGNTRTVALPLVDTDMPNIFISATIFSRTGIDTVSTEIAVSAESKRLQFELKPDKSQYLPGETVSLEVSGKDEKGKPVDAEIGVWAIDKALFELRDQGGGDIFETFWRKRYANTASAHSLQGILFTSNLAERGGCFTGDTPVFMSDGSQKPIKEIQPGEQILTRKSEADSTLVSARVIRIHTVKEDGYLVINGGLRVTAAHRMFVNGRWLAAGNIQVGDELVDVVGKSIRVETITFEREAVTVYNLFVERYHTYFAGDVWVHNNKDGGGRSVFKDTAYWNPRVRLGEDGKAQVTFKLPDNTTTWVISAVGANLATQVGQTTAEIRVSQNTIIRPGLPTLMRIGDRIEAAATVSNNTDESLDYSVTATFDAGSIADGAERTLTLAPHTSDRLTYLLLPEKATDLARFAVSAVARGHDSKFSDAITSTVPVRWSEFTDRTAEIGDGNIEFPLSLPDDVIRDRSHITLDLSSSLLGTLPAAMRNLVQYPYGCVEQTTSRFIPVILARQEKELFADALKEKDTDAMLKQGIKNLTELQKNDGSWGFWHEGDSNPYLTAYVVEALVQARTLGIETEKIDALLENAKHYLDSEPGRILADIHWLPTAPQASLPENIKKQKVNSENLLSIMYARSLLSMTIPGGQRLEGEYIAHFRQLDPNIVALGVMTNIRAGELDPEKNGVNALVALAKRDAAGRIYWETGVQAYYASQDASTALAVRALSLARYDREFVKGAVRYLEENRRAGYWSNTFATSQAARAIIDFYRSTNPTNAKPKYIVTLDGNEVSRGVINSPRQNISLPIDTARLSANSMLKIEVEGPGDVYSTLSKSFSRRAESFTGFNHGLSVERRYANKSEPRSLTLAVGDTVQVDIQVSGVDRLNDRLVVADHLPAGMVAVRTGYKNEGENVDENSYYYGEGNVYIDEYTEDGIVATADTWSARTFHLEYLARVVNAGEFTVPPVSAELMYAPEMSGYSSSDRVTLTRDRVITEIPETVVDGKVIPTVAKIFRISGSIVVLVSVVAVLVAALVFLKNRRSSQS